MRILAFGRRDSFTHVREGAWKAHPWFHESLAKTLHALEPSLYKKVKKHFNAKLKGGPISDLFVRPLPDSSWSSTEDPASSSLSDTS